MASELGELNELNDDFRHNKQLAMIWLTRLPSMHDRLKVLKWMRFLMTTSHTLKECHIRNAFQYKLTINVRDKKLELPFNMFPPPAPIKLRDITFILFPEVLQKPSVKKDVMEEEEENEGPIELIEKEPCADAFYKDDVKPGVPYISPPTWECLQFDFDYNLTLTKNNVHRLRTEVEQKKAIRWMRKLISCDRSFHEMEMRNHLMYLLALYVTKSKLLPPFDEYPSARPLKEIEHMLPPVNFDELEAIGAFASGDIK